MGKKLFTIALCLFISIGAAWAQNTVTGTVTDESGQPLAGASVLVAGTTVGVNTDLEGNYSVTVPKNGILVFSFIQYFGKIYRTKKLNNGSRVTGSAI